MQMETAIIAALITAVIGLVGYIATHQLAIHRDTRNARIAAGIKFREKILKELLPVYPIVSKWPQNNVDGFFKSIFPAMQNAVEEFRPLVPLKKQRCFDKAWLHYYCAYPEDMKEQCYHHYTGSHDPGKETQQQATERAARDFQMNVSKLLSFAEVD